MDADASPPEETGYTLQFYMNFGTRGKGPRFAQVRPEGGFLRVLGFFGARRKFGFRAAEADECSVEGDIND